MPTYTPILKLKQPDFDQEPWDQDINGDLSILDAAYGLFFGTGNVVGVWLNSHAYTSGQAVVDTTDSSFWTCNISHTSAAAPTSFATDRTDHPSYWSQSSTSAHDYANQAASSASAAAGSATSAATSATNAANSAASIGAALPLAGGTMTGLLILSADPTNVLGAVTKQYVDARVGGTGYLPLTGGILTGYLTLNASPTQPLTLPLSSMLI